MNRDSRKIPLQGRGVCAVVLAWALLAPLTVLAQDHGEFGPLTPKTLPQSQPPPPPASGPVPAAQGDETVIGKKLEGVVVASSPDEVQKKGVKLFTPEARDKGVRFMPGMEPAEQAELQIIIQDYLGKPYSILTINQMLRDIVRWYRTQDRPLVDAYLPEQDLKGDLIQIVVTEAARGTVKVEGNKWFATPMIAAHIRTEEGAPMKASAINSDVGWLNRNPFLQTDLVYASGEQPGTTDIILKARDRFPVRFYTSYDDSGNKLTGYDRYTEGFNWGNVGGIGDQFNYQFMSDSRFDLLKAHSASYVHDFPWHQSLTLFGSYADTKAIFPPTLPFSSSGDTWQTSLRYTIPIGDLKLPFGIYNHEVVLGYDFKESNSLLLYNQASLTGPTPTSDVSQFTIGYNASLPDPYGATSFTSAVFYSPGGMTQADSHDAFVQANASSDSYTYLKLGLNRVTKLPWDFTLIDKFTFQQAWARLIGSEQLGLGGYDTVRGYDDREANGDDGYIFSNEIRAPAFSLGHFISSGYSTDQLQFLAFMDYGGVSQYRPDDLTLGSTPSTDPNVNLWGTGVGLRYTLAPFLSVRFDYGWQLISPAASLFYSSNDSRGSLGVTVSY